MQNIKLNNGVEMPMEGFGVFQVPKAECKDVVLNAIRTGYRLIDTASSYQNEEAVGAAVREAVDSGIVKREDLFNINESLYSRDGLRKFKKAFSRSLEKLELELP